MSNENQNPSKSSKYEAAVNRATGKAPATTPAEIDTHPMIETFNQADVEAEMKSGKYEFAPQNFKLEEFQSVRGMLEGNGAPAEFEDPITHELKLVQTWIISSMDGSQRVSILSSVQLDKKLAPFRPGDIVRIFRGKDVNIPGGRRMTEYMVRGDKLPERRQWAAKPVLEAASQPQLPAPSAPETSTPIADLTA